MRRSSLQLSLFSLVFQGSELFHRLCVALFQFFCPHQTPGDLRHVSFELNRPVQFLQFQLLIEDLLGFVHVVFDVLEDPRIVAEKVIVDRRSFQQRSENVNQFEHRFEPVAVGEGLIGNTSDASIEVTDTAVEVFHILDEGLERERNVLFTHPAGERGLPCSSGPVGCRFCC